MEICEACQVWRTPVGFFDFNQIFDQDTYGGFHKWWYPKIDGLRFWRYPHDSGNPMKPPYHQKSASESSHVIYAEIRRCQCSLFPRCGREEIRDLKWLWKWLDVYWKIEFWVVVPDTVANCSQAIFMTMLKSTWKWLVISYHRTPGTGRKKIPCFLVLVEDWSLRLSIFLRSANTHT